MTTSKSVHEVLLYGMGGHALVLMDACRDMGIEIAGYFDDQVKAVQRDGQNLPPFLGPYRSDCLPELPVIVAIGNNEVREQISLQLVHKPFTLIHPSALVSPTAMINEGSVLLQRTIVQAYAQIGRQVIVNAGTVVDHEAILEDFCHVRSLAYIGGAARVVKCATVAPLQLVERNTTFGG